MTASPRSRRHFLRGMIAAGVAPLVLPSRLLGAGDASTPSNKIALGFIGTGDHGRNVNLASMLTQPDAQIVALCDVDAKHLRMANEMVAKQSGRALPASALHRDWREVIARRDIDAIVISTPDHWHTLIAMAALRRNSSGGHYRRSSLTGCATAPTQYTSSRKFRTR